MPTVYLAYGTNMGHRQNHIALAAKLLTQNKIYVTRISQPVDTKPLGGVPQANFLNGVIAAETHLSPLGLLKKIKIIEKKMGRVKILKNGPRPIDIDILLYGNLKIKTDQLHIPHPEINQRRFVREPLKDVQKKVQSSIWNARSKFTKTNRKRQMPVL